MIIHVRLENYYIFEFSLILVSHSLLDYLYDIGTPISIINRLLVLIIL